MTSTGGSMIPGMSTIELVDYWIVFLPRMGYLLLMQFSFEVEYLY
jgi:hypothetical protein